MRARDQYHQAIRAALLNDGWVITHDPYLLEFDGADTSIDFSAEQDSLDPVLAAERGAARIVVEVTTFTSPSVMVDLEQAFGQYVMLRSWLSRTEPERLLYLAVDTETALNVFDQEFGRIVAADLQIHLMVVDIVVERIVTWTHIPATDKS